MLKQYKIAKRNLVLKIKYLFVVQGIWTGSQTWNTLVDPLNGEPFIKVAEIDEKGIQVYIL